MSKRFINQRKNVNFALKTDTLNMSDCNNQSFEEAFAAALSQFSETIAQLKESYHHPLTEAEETQIVNVLHLQEVCHPDVVEVRPQELECDVVRFQNNKEKWVALVGLLNGYPYEIFTGLQDDEEGIMLPKSVTHGKIVKRVLSDNTKRYDFQFRNKRGYQITIEGLSEKFNPEYWNYAKLISGVLRYRMPLVHVLKLVNQLQMTSESINTWKQGVARALKKYTGAEIVDEEEDDNKEDALRLL